MRTKVGEWFDIFALEIMIGGVMVLSAGLGFVLGMMLGGSG